RATIRDCASLGTLPESVLAAAAGATERRAAMRDDSRRSDLEGGALHRRAAPGPAVTERILRPLPGRRDPVRAARRHVGDRWHDSAVAAWLAHLEGPVDRSEEHTSELQSLAKTV